MEWTDIEKVPVHFLQLYFYTGFHLLFRLLKTVDAILEAYPFHNIYIVFCLQRPKRRLSRRQQPGRRNETGIHLPI